MKKILTILFFIQMCVISFYSLFFLQSDAEHQLLRGYHAFFELNFNENIEDFHFFLDLLERKELHAVRMVYPQSTTMIAYTTDVTLNGQIILQSGRFPEMGTNEFISNVDTGEISQVGIFNDIAPGYHLMISSLTNPQNFALDGIYQIGTSDFLVVEQLMAELTERVFFVDFWRLAYDEVPLLHRFAFSFTSYFQIFEFIIIFIVFFLCLVFSSMQYAINQLRSASIFKIHGYSKGRMSKLITFSIIKRFIFAATISYAIAVIYSFYMGYIAFLSDMTIYFILFATFFILCYCFIVNVTMYVYLKVLNQIQFVKGKKSHVGSQVFNHGLKILFTVLFLSMFYYSVNGFINLNQRLEHMTYWDKAHHTYLMSVSSVGQIHDKEIEMELIKGQSLLYDYLSDNHNGFIMDSSNIWFLDRDMLPYENMAGRDMRTSPSGYRINISPNFLSINPIHAVNGIDIQKQIIWEHHVLNILVPERLSPYEDEILRQYLTNFYFQQVLIENGYNRAFGLPLNETMITDLSVNIIYVLDDQYYFSFNPHLRPETSNRILDPIAVIYTGNVHQSHLVAWFTSSLFFQTSAINAYDEIFPALIKYGLTSAILSVNPIYDQNVRIVQDVRGKLNRLLIFMVISLFAGVAITYNLIANYFQAHKYKLTIKRHFGYHPIKRNQKFIVCFLGYSIPLVILMSFILGLNVMLIGIIFLFFDVSIALIFEHQLMRKSFAQIMKGER